MWVKIVKLDWKGPNSKKNGSGLIIWAIIQFYRYYIYFFKWIKNCRIILKNDPIDKSWLK